VLSLEELSEELRLPWLQRLELWLLSVLELQVQEQVVLLPLVLLQVLPRVVLLEEVLQVEGGQLVEVEQGVGGHRLQSFHWRWWIQSTFSFQHP